MSTLFHQITLSAPLFILVFVGYGVMRVAHWPKSMSEALSKFVFTLALPALLFQLLSDFSKLPPVDARLLIAFFGGCFLVFALGRLVAWKVFRLDGTAQSVFALGGIFSNNVMLGLPIAKMLLGDAALPSVALVIVFNALILWTLVTISVEWSRHGNLSVQGFRKTLISVLTNPVVAAILLGAAWGLTGWKLPQLVCTTLGMVSTAAAPMALIALGMGLAEFGVSADWRQPISIALLKLVAHPLAVWSIAMMLKLPAMETRVVVLMASIATGANVYLMARHLQSMESTTASSLILSTVLAACTSPLLMVLMS
ncbi:MAG: Auxin Efflux Carrier [Proteobacteria bacterium]|nr:Auxin Efflux Carrier [Pseudomonadota bacterium]